MNHLQELSTLLADIQSTCNTILKQSLSLIKKIDEAIQSILEQCSGADEEEAKTVAQQISIEMTHDASTAIDELMQFIVYAEDTYSINTKGCPFLANIWHGDTYDKTELEGLKEFRADLATQLGEINMEKFVEKCVKRMLKE